MAIDFNEIRTKYATNREETLELACETYGKDISEWSFTEVSQEEWHGTGNDVVAIFRGTLTKEGDETIYITELIDVHRLAYSYSFRYGEEVIPEDEEGEEEL